MSKYAIDTQRLVFGEIKPLSLNGNKPFIDMSKLGDKYLNQHGESFIKTHSEAIGSELLQTLKNQNALLKSDQEDREHNRTVKSIEQWTDIGKDIITAAYKGWEMGEKSAHASWMREEMGEYQDHKINMEEKTIALQEKAMTEGVALKEKVVEAQKQVALAEIAEKGKTARNGQNKVAMRMRIRAQGRPAKVFV